MFVKLRVEIPFNYAHLSNSVSEDQFSTDEPILRLQRNVFLSPGAELQIEHPEVVRLLYCEAMENVIEGLYPIDIASKYGLSFQSTDTKDVPFCNNASRGYCFHL